MKKWVWLGVLTTILCVAAWQLGAAARPQTVELETRVLHAAAVEETVSCSGRIESAAPTAVYAPRACVIGRVLVTNGQTVRRGEPLFEVDREKTLAVMAEQDGAAAVRAAVEDTVPLTVTAPADGSVSVRHSTVGEAVAAEEQLAVITDHAPVRVRLAVSERYISRIAVGQTVAVSGAGFGKAQYRGHIVGIADSASQEVGTSGTKTTVEATVAFDEGVADDTLRVGLSAQAAVTVSVQENSFTVPYDAVSEDAEGREYVYILKAGTPQKRVIETLAELPDGFLVKEGLTDGERLVLTPERIAAHAVYTEKERTHA